jgi:type II secretory pathway component GspD/PulD (secretin)
VATLSAAYPSVHFAVGADDRTIAARGTQGTIERAAALLALIDRAPPQLRFDVCVIQFERGEAVDHGIRGSVESTASGLAGAGAGSGAGAVVAGSAAPVLVASSFDRVFDLDFDFVSALGYRAALAISDELSSSRARLVLDTSVRVREGETARVENSTTYRYRETPIAENGQIVSSIVREIDSGLLIELSGRLLSDRSIDVDVQISLSRNGADMTGTGNPPPTSRRVVTSRVRVFPGEPLVIGGLLQQEETQSESRFPILGRIPLLKRLINTRSQREEETELVVYLSAAPDVPTNPVLRRREQIDALRAIQASRITAERGAQTMGDGDER